MTPSNDRIRTIGSRLLTLALFGLLVVLGINIFLGIRIKRATSAVTVSAFAADAVISISQNNKGAEVVGTGTAKLRLKPGDYQLAASSAGNTSTARIHVQLGRGMTVNLKEDTIPILPSPANIIFVGIDKLVARGITTSQSTSLQNLFFDYNQKAKTVMINAGSIANGVRSPDSGAPFTLNFTGIIDGKAYRATIAYADLSDMRLTIYDPQTGAQLFDKSNV